MSDVGASLDRARDRVAQMQARAAATDDLLASGALNDLTATPDADLERQLSAGTTRADVERQLQSMKNSGTSDRNSRTDTRGAGPDAWLSIGQRPDAS
jgi:phage shock protein A